MATYTIINGTETQLANVNGGGTDVEALSAKDGVTLTNGELAAVASTQGVAVTSDLTGVSFAQQVKRVIGLAAQYLNPLA